MNVAGVESFMLSALSKSRPHVGNSICFLLDLTTQFSDPVLVIRFHIKNQVFTLHRMAY